MKTDYCKRVYFNTDNQNSIDDLIDYLTKISGKSLKTSRIRHYIFKTSWKSKENLDRSRCQIKAGIEYLKFLRNRENSKQQIQTLIADILPYIESLDDYEDISFIIGNSNIIHSTIHFHSAKNLFFNHQILKSHQDNYMSDLLTVYSLRLSLEKKIRAMLGIDYAKKSNGSKVGLSTFIDTLKEITCIQYFEKIDWQEIILVNDWANHFMHRHIRPYPWTIYQAILILEPLLNSKKPIKLKSGQNLYSFDSPGYIEKEKEYDEEIEKILNRKIPDIQISKLDYKEIVIGNE